MVLGNRSLTVQKLYQLAASTAPSTATYTEHEIHRPSLSRPSRDEAAATTAATKADMYPYCFRRNEASKVRGIQAARRRRTIVIFCRRKATSPSTAASSFHRELRAYCGRVLATLLHYGYAIGLPEEYFRCGRQGERPGMIAWASPLATPGTRTPG